MTHYELLGVAADADTATIRKAYRKLAAKCHPDVCKDSDAEERFKRLGAAVDILCDKDKRYFYDLSIMPPMVARPGDSLFGEGSTVTFGAAGGVEIRFTVFRQG